MGNKQRRKSGESINSNNTSTRISTVSEGDNVNRSIIEQVEEAVIESITVIETTNR